MSKKSKILPPPDVRVLSWPDFCRELADGLEGEERDKAIAMLFLLALLEIKRRKKADNLITPAEQLWFPGCFALGQKNTCDCPKSCPKSLGCPFWSRCMSGAANGFFYESVIEDDPQNLGAAIRWAKRYLTKEEVDACQEFVDAGGMAHKKVNA